MRGRLRAIAINLGLAGVGLILALLMAEMALRLIGYEKPIFIVWQEDFGVLSIPGARGTYKDEGRAVVEINSQGFRDIERLTDKPANTFRIAVLGDSFIEAIEVGRRDTLPAVLERRLSGCGALNTQRVEVLNFGVRSFGPAQELLLLKERVLQYQPDIVLLAFYPGNDVLNDSRSLDGDPFKPYFSLQDGALLLDASYRARVRAQMRWTNRFWYYVALQNSRFAQLVHEARKSVIASVAGAGLPAVAANEWEVYPEMYREPEDPRWRSAWQVTEALLGEMHHEATSHSARFIVTVVTNGIDIYPVASERERLSREFGLVDLGYAERRVAAVGARDGFEVIPLRPAMTQYAEEHHAFLHGFGQQLGHYHWNEEGHRVAADLVAARICDELLRR